MESGCEERQQRKSAEGEVMGRRTNKCEVLQCDNDNDEED